MSRPDVRLPINVDDIFWQQMVIDMPWATAPWAVAHRAMMVAMELNPWWTTWVHDKMVKDYGLDGMLRMFASAIVVDGPPSTSERTQFKAVIKALRQEYARETKSQRMVETVDVTDHAWVYDQAVAAPSAEDVALDDGRPSRSTVELYQQVVDNLTPTQLAYIQAYADSGGSLAEASRNLGVNGRQLVWQALSRARRHLDREGITP